MKQEQDQELKRYTELLREAEQRKDETGIRNLRREIDRLCNSAESPNNPDKR
jgi:hypothetical protein